MSYTVENIVKCSPFFPSILSKPVFDSFVESHVNGKILLFFLWNFSLFLNIVVRAYQFYNKQNHQKQLNLIFCSTNSSEDGHWNLLTEISGLITFKLTVVIYAITNNNV